MLTGSTEQISDSLQELERQERDERMALDAEYAERALTQRLFEEKRGICDFCRKPIDQPAHADVLYATRDGKKIAILIHDSEWLKASLQGWKLAPEIA